MLSYCICSHDSAAANITQIQERLVNNFVQPPCNSLPRPREQFGLALRNDSRAWKVWPYSSHLGST